MEPRGLTAPRRRGAGRPAQIDLPAIATAAVAVGFDRLTLAAVAERLGVSSPALYHHVRDRTELTHLAVDYVVDRMSWPLPSPDWRQYLSGCGWALWELLEAHTGLAHVASGFVIPPQGVILALYAVAQGVCVLLLIPVLRALLAGDTGTAGRWLLVLAVAVTGTAVLP